MAPLPFDRVQLIADVQREERLELYVYDDKTGKRIVPGTLVVGHPTVGYGLALDVDPLTESEAAALMVPRLDRHIETIQKLFPWVTGLTDARQRALYDMSFNLGDHGLAEFADFLHLLRSGEYVAAADDLENTKWYGEVGDRAKRIVGLIRNG